MRKHCSKYASNMSVTQGLSAANKRTAIDVKIVCERMSRFDGQWYWTNTLQQVSDGLTKVQARQRLVEILRRGYHTLKFDPTFTAGKKLTTEQRQQRENELHQAAEFGASVLCCDEVLLTSDASGSVSLRGMSMCDAGYSGRTVKIVKELRDHNSPFAHPVCCMGSTAVDFCTRSTRSTHRRSCLESMRSCPNMRDMGNSYCVL